MKPRPAYLKPQSSSWTRAGIAAASVILSSLAACDRGTGSSADSPGTQIVLLASDVHVLGTSESIAVVEDLEVLPDGTVWVLNSVEPFFVGFDPDGNVLQMLGRSGGGPGEFEGPAGFVVGGIDGEAWVFDRRRHALIRVSGPDAARREISLPRDAIPPGSVLGGMNLLSNRVRTARLGDEVILPRASIEGEIEASSYWFYTWSPDLVALDTRTDSVRSVIALAEVLGDPRSQVDLSGFPPFPLWYRLWATCPDDEIRVYDHHGNRVRGFTREGVELEATALPPPRYTEVTPRQFARATFEIAAVEALGEVPSGNIEVSAADSARVLDGLIPRLNAAPHELANLLPRYVDFRCDENGTQWIRPLDIDVGGLRGGPVWLRITSDGTTREVHLPDRFDPYRFTSARIWGVQRDEFDVASLAWLAAPRTR